MPPATSGSDAAAPPDLVGHLVGHLHYYAARAAWPALADYLKLNVDVSAALVLADTFVADADVARRIADEGVDRPWRSIFTALFRVRRAVHAASWRDAFEHQRTLTSDFLGNVFANGDAQLLPVLYVLLTDLADLAAKADQECRAAGQRAEHVSYAMQTFQSAYRTCMHDHRDVENRRCGALRVINIMVKVLMRTDEHNLLAKMFNTVNHRLAEIADDVPQRDLVTYTYWYARDCVLNDQYDQARLELEWVLARAPPALAPAVLTFLVPLNMAFGKLPSTALLNRYQAMDALYGDIARAIRAGDVHTFHQQVLTHSPRLTQLGLADLVEGLQWIALRRVIKMAYLVNSSDPKLPLTHIHAALRLAHGPDAQWDEQSTLDRVRVLIGMKLIFGYLGATAAGYILVLRKTNPFPPVRDELRHAFELWDTWNRGPGRPLVARSS